MQLRDFTYPRLEYWFYFKGLWRERGAKAVYKQFQKHLRRPWSRALVHKYSAPTQGRGLEIGVGARTIAPVSRTPLAHLIEDFEKDVPDDDTTHVEEWIENVTKAGGIPEHYRHIPQDYLARTGSIHHHVWIAEDMKEVLEYLGLDVMFCENEVPDRMDSFVVVGRKK